MEIEIAEGCYIESNNPVEKFMIPTKLSFSDQDGLSIAEIKYPEPRIKDVQWAKKQLSIYEGSLKIEAVIKVNDNSPRGEKYIKGKLSYQPCTEKACMMPRSEEFQAKIVVG